jgi:nitronate monooxygenase
MTTSVTRLVGIDNPIVLAPLAGGPSTPALAAAVSEAGGLGSLGVGYLAPGAIGDEIAAVRRATARPFAVNLFVDRPGVVDRAEVDHAWALLAPYRHELGMPETAPPERFTEPYDEQLGAVLEARVAVVSFTFGLPDAGAIDALHDNGTLVMITVTSEPEGRAAASAGADLLCAQGAEAGGHRASFLGATDDGLVGLVALVPRVVDSTGLPVVASGGIMDGRGVAAALALGAGAVQLGTAFLRCPEAGTSLPYRQAIAESNGSTTLTSAISGKLARGLPNRLTRDLADAPVPAYPVMNALTRELRRAAAGLGRSELLSLWAGQGVGATRELPAATLVSRLLDETDTAG